jgi:DNA-binding transcriptional LysR family regulator
MKEMERAVLESELISSQCIPADLRMHHRIRPPTFEGICRMAAAGAGIGTIPEVAAMHFQPATPIGIVRLSDAWASRRLVLCCRSESELDPVARSLMKHLAGVELA